MDFKTEHNEVKNEMICTYSNEYKSITDKSTGDTKFYKNDEVIIDEKGMSTDRLEELQEQTMNKVSKFKL